MDLLYSRYANPMELMNHYINENRFGEFVSNILDVEYKRKREERERDEDWKLWFAYLLGMHEESFKDWKREIFQTAEKAAGRVSDMNMTEDDISNIIESTFQDRGR